MKEINCEICLGEKGLATEKVGRASICYECKLWLDEQ